MGVASGASIVFGKGKGSTVGVSVAGKRVVGVGGTKIVGVPVGVAVRVGVIVGVRVGVRVGLGVKVGSTGFGVTVGGGKTEVCVGKEVGVANGVTVRVGVFVGIGVPTVNVDVGVRVGLGVFVGLEVLVGRGVRVLVGSLVGGRRTGDRVLPGSGVMSATFTMSPPPGATVAKAGGVARRRVTSGSEGERLHDTRSRREASTTDSRRERPA